MMSKEIDFYYEFSSPYGYMGAKKIEALAAKHGAKINWKPFLLGSIFKLVGSKPLTEYPFKGEYSQNDMLRTARLHDIDFTMPAIFPFMAVNACRLVLWAAGEDQDLRGKLTMEIYDQAYSEGKDITDTSVLLDIAEKHDFDREEAESGIKSPEIKAMLKSEVDKGIEAKIFGSPFFIVDGESFWGFDRMDQLDRWLETGGW